MFEKLKPRRNLTQVEDEMTGQVLEAGFAFD